MADTYLVDTGVFVRWYLDQVGFEHAQQIKSSFRAGSLSLETIDHVRFEIGHVLRTNGLLHQKISKDEYVLAVRSLDDAGVVVHRTDADALQRAATLAASRYINYYDALIVDRAVQRGLPLLTADKSLCDAAAGLVQTELLRGIR